ATLTHQFQLRNADTSKWVQAHVDATNPRQGKVVHVVDFVADAAYRALPWDKQDPTVDGGFDMITDPQDTTASPKGWHIDAPGKPATTSGQAPLIGKLIDTELPEGVTTSMQTSDGPQFDYEWDATAEPVTPNNIDAARVNAFYVTNKVHDVMYKYGFTEAAYNFQDDNYGKGGVGNDRVQMQVQAESGVNNANFATPPDGQTGHCNMYLWAETSPMRDGSLENDIITHELTHGLTNRMTGGGTGACLSTTEAGGMGEGWSDTVAFWSEQNSATPVDFTMGSWVMDNPAGIRSHPYSTNTDTNPYTYATVGSQNEVHAIGEVWALMLVEVFWALVEKHGFNKDITNVQSPEGNIVFLHLLVDALALQPCNPAFTSARDAILQADANRYAGANKCTIWKAFAKRGLGPKAANYVDDKTLPEGC
ncbi:hypothetical protein M407DRAFT_78274, partial [Tulasnella calospora MUT 4182]